MVCRASSWVLTCQGGSTPSTPSVTLTWCQITCFSHKRTMEEHVWMARAFLLHFLGAYLFTNGGQVVSLRWLTLFQGFADAWRANWGQACLAYLYSSLDTLSRGTLRQLVGPWKLLKVSSLSISCIFICSLQSSKLYHLANYHFANCTILQTVPSCI